MTEELAAALMSVASTVALHLGVASIIAEHGSEAQCERYLLEMASYDTVGVLGLSEANAGSDKLAMETTAQRDGEEWILNGHKQWVTNYRDADVVLTYAKTGLDEDAPRNISAFLVPTEAFEVENVWETLGAKSAKAVKVSLSNVRVPDDQLIGEEGEGTSIAVPSTPV
jgi:alkylation response protein AidB-like acyl-CoA dehydrogenase